MGMIALNKFLHHLGPRCQQRTVALEQQLFCRITAYAFIGNKLARLLAGLQGEVTVGAFPRVGGRYNARNATQHLYPPESPG